MSVVAWGAKKVNEKLTKLLEEMAPEDKQEAIEKVIDLEAAKLVREVIKALEQAGFKAK